MLLALVVALIVAVICLAYVTLKRNEYFADAHTSDSTVGVGKSAVFYKCNDPLSFNENGMCLDSTQCPVGFKRTNANSKYCVKDMLKHTPTEECVCPPGYGYSNISDKQCTQKICPSGWKMDIDESCMLSSNLQPLSMNKLSDGKTPQQMQDLLKRTAAGNVKGLCTSPNVYLYGYDSNLDPGFCVTCPPSTWPVEITSSNEMPSCTNDTGIHALYTKQKFDPKCTVRETFVNSLPSNKKWNFYDEHLQINCAPTDFYDKAFKQCYSAPCDAGLKKTGDNECGIMGKDVKKTCACPEGYGFATVNDTVCKSVSCPNGYLLNNQECEKRENIVGAPKFITSGDCEKGFTKIIKNVTQKNSKPDTVGACVKCANGTPLAGPLDNTQTSTFYCKVGTQKPLYKDADTKQPVCG